MSDRSSLTSQAVKIELALGGVRLRALSVGGDGEPVVILHGFTGSAESMESVAESLRVNYAVFLLELIGHGGSESPPDVEHYEMNACADQIVRAVEMLGLCRPHLLGYSMGGRAAIAAAVRRPDHFASLVLVGATAGIADRDLRRERIQADRALADRIERGDLDRFIDEWMALPIFSTQSSLGESALARARAQRLRNQPAGLANSLRGMGAGAQAPLFDELDRIKVPVLLVVGGLDLKFQTIASSLKTSFHDAKVEIIPNVGHAAHLEAPAEFGEITSSFLESVGGLASTDASRAADERIRNKPSQPSSL